MDKVQTNSVEIGFEEQLWKAACELRGNIDASKYKNVFLGLIFLKCISDRFEKKWQELLSDPEADPEDIDEYLSEGVFYVPPSARWSQIAKAARTPQIGIIIDEAMISIEKENSLLRGALPKNFAHPDLDKMRLGEIVNLFSNIQMDDQSDNMDLLGRAYEYCLSRFAANEGKNAGEFYTPSCIVRTLIEVLMPYDGKVYDPCCGSGGMFVQSIRFVNSHRGNIRNISIYGQESNPDTRKLCIMNLALRRIEAQLGNEHADTFFNDLHPQLKANYILANPPFNNTQHIGEKLPDDVRWKFGIPPKSNDNYAWIQHMIHHLAPNGKMGMVLANGSLSTTNTQEIRIRASIIDADLIECIVTLPDRLFYSTGIPVSLWFITRNKAQKGKILFIDARGLGTMVTRKLRELSDEDIARIANTVHAFQNDDGYADVKGFCKVATLDEVRETNYSLVPGRYVEIDDSDRMTEEEVRAEIIRVKQELRELFARSEELDKKIAAILDADD